MLGYKSFVVLAKSMSWSVSYRNLVYIVYIRDILANLAIISLIHESIWYVGVCGNICVHYSLSVSDGEHNGVKLMSKKKLLFNKFDMKSCTIFCPKLSSHCTEVRFASFFSGKYTTMAVINTPERKLAKRTSVQ